MSQQDAQIERRKLLSVLEDIVRKCDLDALAIVTQKDAEEIAFFTEIETNSDIFCTLAAATLDTATKVTQKFNHGAVTELAVIGDKGFTIMSPIGENFILIGAGRDFFSMGKTILILRESIQYIPSSLVPKRPISSRRKACSHFCRQDGLYCCICAERSEICELCETSVKHKQLQAEKEKQNSIQRTSSKSSVKQQTLLKTSEPQKKKKQLMDQQADILFSRVMDKIELKTKELATTTSKKKKTAKKKKIAKKKKTKKKHKTSAKKPLRKLKKPKKSKKTSKSSKSINSPSRKKRKTRKATRKRRRS